MRDLAAKAMTYADSIERKALAGGPDCLEEIARNARLLRRLCERHGAMTQKPTGKPRKGRK